MLFRATIGHCLRSWRYGLEVNVDTVNNRVGIALATSGCGNGDDAGNVTRMAQNNLSTCVVRYAVCYPDAVLGACVPALDYSQLFGAGIARVGVDIWLEQHLDDSPLNDGVLTPVAALELAPNTSVADNGPIAIYDMSLHSSGNDDTTFVFNPSVTVSADGYYRTTLDSRKASSGYSCVDGEAGGGYRSDGTNQGCDMASIEIEDDGDGTYGDPRYGGAYAGSLTLRGRFNGLVKGDHNVTVRVNAYLVEVRTNVLSTHQWW